MPSPLRKTARADLEGPESLPESDCTQSPGVSDESPPQANSEALSVGAVVRHLLNPDLVGRIVCMDTTRAKIELLAWPSPWFQRWYSNRLMPALLDNLELVK